MTLTKEQFRAQFKFGPLDLGEFVPTFSEQRFGYGIYRALQLLLLLDTDGKFYSARPA